MSAESTDRLYDEGCCEYCGKSPARAYPHSADTYDGVAPVLCAACSTTPANRKVETVRANRRLKVTVPRPAPPEKFKVGDVLPKGTRFHYPKPAGTGIIYEFTEDAKLSGDGEWWVGNHESKCGKWASAADVDGFEVLSRPIPPPQLAPGSAGSVDAAHRETAVGGASAQPFSTSTQPSEPGHSPATPKPDPYNPQDLRKQVRETYDRTISHAMLTRDAEYRKRVASVLSDLDRSSSSRRAAIGERTWVDKMGRTMSWTGRVR